MTVDTEEVLLVVVGSAWSALTVAVLTAVPTVVAVTEIVNVAVAFNAKFPAEHVTVVPLKAHPVLAELNVTCDGSGSVTVTVVAADGPLFFTVIE